MTAHHAEAAVERAVRALNMPVWLAQFVAKTGGPARPLFPDYLFFQADLSRDRWQNLYRAPGVDRILGHRGQPPTPLRMGALDELLGQAALDGVIYPRLPSGQLLGRIAPGARVRVAAGRFAGWEGVCSWSSRDRVAVLLGVMGCAATVQMPRYSVELGRGRMSERTSAPAGVRADVAGSKEP